MCIVGACAAYRKDRFSYSLDDPDAETAIGRAGYSCQRPSGAPVVRIVLGSVSIARIQ